MNRFHFYAIQFLLLFVSISWTLSESPTSSPRYRSDISTEIGQKVKDWAGTEQDSLENIKAEIIGKSKTNEDWRTALKALGSVLSFFIVGVGLLKVRYEDVWKWALCGVVGCLPWISAQLPVSEDKALEETIKEQRQVLKEIGGDPLQHVIAYKSALDILNHHSSPGDTLPIKELAYLDIVKKLDFQFKKWEDNAKDRLKKLAQTDEKNVGTAFSFPAFDIVPSAFAQQPLHFTAGNALPAISTSPTQVSAVGLNERLRQVQLVIKNAEGTLLVFDETRSIDKTFYSNQEYNYLNIPGIGFGSIPEDALRAAKANAKYGFPDYMKKLVAASGPANTSELIRPLDALADTIFRESTLPIASYPYYEKYYSKAGVFACVVFFKVTKQALEERLIKAFPGDSLKRNSIAFAVRTAGPFTDTLVADASYLTNPKVDTLAAITALSRAASKYYAVGRYDMTVSKYDQAIRLDSLNPRPFGRKGYALLKLGKYSAASKSLEQALTLNPRDNWDRYNLALSQLHSGSLENRAKAIENLKLVIRSDPKFRDRFVEDPQSAKFRNSPWVMNLGQ